jgi:hypothetical protein
MTFEEFEKAKTKDLRRQAKECFDECSTEDMTAEVRTATLFEAQFYLSEKDRRHDSWISTRDLILEIIVIILIGGEILLAIQQGRDQGRLMDRRNGNLTKMNATASATAGTLQSLQSTTEAMNSAVQNQLAQFYDPSVVVHFDGATKKMSVLNVGVPTSIFRAD